MARSRPKCGFYIAKCYLHQLDTNTRYINYNNNRFFFFLLFIFKVASKHMDCHKKSLKILYIIFIDFFMVLYRPFAAHCTLQQGCQTYGSRTPLTYLTITNTYLAFTLTLIWVVMQSELCKCPPKCLATTGTHTYFVFVCLIMCRCSNPSLSF